MDLAFHSNRVSNHPPHHSPKGDGGGDSLVTVNPMLKQVVLGYRSPLAVACYTCIYIVIKYKQIKINLVYFLFMHIGATSV